MADETKKPARKVLVYSKNFYLPGLNGNIGGLPVSKEIDDELTAKLANGKKASDYHQELADYQKDLKISKMKIGIRERKPK